MNPSSLVESFRRLLAGDPPLQAVERKAARHWVKERLADIFPELRNDPRALQELYDSLDLEPRPGIGRGNSTLYEISLPEKYSRRI